MRISNRYVFGIVMLAFSAAIARAQPAQAPARTDSLLQQQFIIDNKIADQRLQFAPVDALVDWQWGGWLEYYYFNYDDGVQRSRQVHRPGAAIWTRLAIDQSAHEIFARVRLRYDWFKPGDEANLQQDWVGPNFDRAWYNVDVFKALHIAQPGDPVRLKMRIGRQPVLFGTGYALDLPLDAVTLQLDIDKLRVEGLIGKTIASYPNLDRSFPVDSHSNRRFYGVQLSYQGFDRHVPFMYGVWNDDKIDERPKDPLQDYSYDSFYFGAGSKGSLAHNLNYWLEGVYQSGRNFGDGMFLRKNHIDAWGIDVGIEYLFDSKTNAWVKAARPRVGFEYMFASGDSNRLFSPTNARGGLSRGDREDNSFNAFGFRDTGLALSPALSNIHVFKWGGSMAPFAKHDFFKDLEVGANFFAYAKHHSRGAISDFTADKTDGFIGWEMDYFVNWRLASDLSWTLRWGTFFPDEAYTDTQSRHFLLTGLTWSF